MKISAFVSTLALGLFVASSAFALDAADPAAPAKPAAKTATTTKSTTATKPDAAKDAKSIECSQKADAQGLHGKERKKFREKCKKGE